jgi:hypothetical protein
MSFIQFCLEIYLICIGKSFNAFENPRECDILSEFLLNIEIGGADGDPKENPGHSF